MRHVRKVCDTMVSLIKRGREERVDGRGVKHRAGVYVCAFKDIIQRVKTNLGVVEARRARHPISCSCGPDMSW